MLAREFYGNTLTARALREPAERMGHSSTRAALVCLHSTSDRQRTIADAVGTVRRCPRTDKMRPWASTSTAILRHNDSIEKTTLTPAQHAALRDQVDALEVSASIEIRVPAYPTD
jgi:hypothetical protein